MSSSSRSSVAASIHCKSSKNSTSGRSPVANTLIRRRSRSWSRALASNAGSAVTGACCPMTCASSGMRSIASAPFGSSARSIEPRHRASSSSDMPSRARIRLPSAWTNAENGTSCLSWSNLPEANRQPSGPSCRCKLSTSDDFPIPAPPLTSTSRVEPSFPTRPKASRSLCISSSRPYSFSRIAMRRERSCSPSANISAGSPAAYACAQRRRSQASPAAV